MKRKLPVILAILLVLFLAACTPDTPASHSVENAVENAVSQMFSLEEIKQIIFSHAKVKASDAWDVEVDLDTENGKLVYEISFDAGGYEFDYEIDASTGKVLRSEKERND